MKLNLKRFWLNDDFSIGLLTVDGKFQCFTLENPERETYIPERTAIPCGTYKVIMYDSPHFGQKMPLLVNVPGHEGIEIHFGNTTFDTKGCILVGTAIQSSYISNSRVAFAALRSKIENETEIEITIEHI